MASEKAVWRELEENALKGEASVASWIPAMRVLDTIVLEIREKLFLDFSRGEALVSKNGFSGDNAFCPTQDSPRFVSSLV